MIVRSMTKEGNVFEYKVKPKTIDVDNANTLVLRLPDYRTINIAVGTWIGWNGTITWDGYGTFYLSPAGFTFGKSLTFVSGSVSSNWLKQSGTPTSTEMYNFLSGHGISGGAGFIVGGSTS